MQERFVFVVEKKASVYQLVIDSFLLFKKLQYLVIRIVYSVVTV